MRRLYCTAQHECACACCAITGHEAVAAGLSRGTLHAVSTRANRALADLAMRLVIGPRRDAWPSAVDMPACCPGLP